MPPRPEFPVFMDPAERYPVGSPEWAGRISSRAWGEYSRAETCGFKPLVRVLDVAVPGKPWLHWPPERPWGSIEVWARALFGLPWAKVLDVLEPVEPEAAQRLRMIAAPELGEPEIGKGKAGPGRGKKTGTDDTRLSRGGNPSYLAARLKRDHPELAADVEAGRMTLRAAAKEAGIVKPTDPYRQLVLWWDKASPKDRTCFHTYLKAWAEKAG
jgi:hypothetical protein